MPNAIVSGTEYLSLPRSSQTWLVEPIVPAGGSVLLYGDPKIGKSYAAMQLAVSLSQGHEWLGFPTRSNGRVVYLQLDTPRSLWAERLEILKADGIPVETVYLADLETLDCFPFDVLNPQHALLLQLALKEIQPTAVIIDTIRECHSGEENDSTIMRNVVSSLHSIVQPAALILVAHSRKPSYESGPDLIGDNRGSGYVVGKMDTILRMGKRSLHYIGRAIEEGTVKLRREDNGLWTPDSSDIDQHVAAVLSNTSLTSIRAKAQALALQINKSEEACRSILRRATMTTTAPLPTSPRHPT